MFPMPDMGAHVEEILAYAIDWLDAMDQSNFLWALTAFWLVIVVITWIIRTVRNPPRLDT